MYTPEEKARIKGRRCGTLELDVVIMPFFEECFDNLTEQEQQRICMIVRV